ncbi:MAG: AMP-binding enzyme [Alphaproteobacteria bacterium]
MPFCPARRRFSRCSWPSATNGLSIVHPCAAARPARAFIVPRPDAPVAADEIIAWSRDNMANYKVPRRVIVVDDLPRNAAGKVLKIDLKLDL